MSDSPILAERVGNQNGILWVTLNRPEKMNALTFPLLHEMRDIFVDARNDRSLRCVVITGSGRGFCAGMDMGGGAHPDAPPPPGGFSVVADGITSVGPVSVVSDARQSWGAVSVVSEARKSWGPVSVVS